MTRKPPSYDYRVETPLTQDQIRRLAARLTQQVGARVAELREMRGYTQARVCREHGFNPSQLSRVEGGKMNITLATACRVAAFLDVRPWEIFVPRDESGLALRARETMPPPPTAEEIDEATEAFQRQVGARVRELRTLQGMSVATFEEFSGIVQSTLSWIENGQYNLRASTVVRLADAIGVTPHELYLPREQSGIRLKSPKKS